ncbi:MAG: hypothetical protein JXN61_02560 [Sedimentisphaerales bacterium]|nr:hypothetical protein [Sedimentisphaerales bacterium]
MKKMLFILACLTPLVCARADVYTVDCGGDPAADFERIQDAIDFASDGDTIVVKPCTYQENIRFKGKRIEVTSLYPDISVIVEMTVITASSDYTVRFDNGETSGSVLTGFTITGRGIHCNGSSPVISKNIITNCNNNAITGVNYPHPLIEKNTITFNGPIAIDNCLGDIIENEITHNGNGGAIHICDGDVMGNVISYNINASDGGGLFYCTGQILDNVIICNEAGGDGGAIYGGGSEIAGNTIFGNKAADRGGGLCARAGTVDNNIIAGNRAAYGSAMADCSAGIRNNTITGNRVKIAGTLSQCPGYIENNIIAFNEGPVGMAGISGVSSNSYNCFWNNNGNNFIGGATQGEGDLKADPCFAMTGHWDANGTDGDPNDDFWIEGDYHVLSENGRWNGTVLRWVYDSSTSPCIDAGFDYWDWKGEYWPHGGRINQGCYGGTSQASMSPLTVVGNVADLNLDDEGLVDFHDLMLLAQMWPYDWPLLREDLDRNGRVDFADYAVLVANWQPFPPPTPSPMTWKSEPNAISTSEITMEAADANSSDNSTVEYRFKEISGNPGASDRDWHSSQIHMDTGLSQGLEYCYIVQARNTVNLVETKWSVAKCARTWSPPSPNPMTWATAPNATSWSSVTMTATSAVATDGGGVEYFFDEISGKPGGSDRDWDASPVFTDTGLYDASTYCYRVKARNAGNKLVTGWSAERCATTPAAPPPTPDPMAWSTPPTAASYSSITMSASVATPGDGSAVEYYFQNVTVTDGSHDRNWGSSRVYTDTGLSMRTQYCYRVKARNQRNHRETGWSPQLCATTPCNDTTPPYFPGGVYWESIPCEQDRPVVPPTQCMYWVVMTAAEAEDDSGGPLQYRFVNTNGPASSGWQTSRYYEYFICFSHKGYDFYVEARDACENVSTASPIIKAWPCE